MIRGQTQKTINGLEADLVVFSSAEVHPPGRGGSPPHGRAVYDFTFHEKRWNRLLVIPVEDIGFGNVEAAGVVKNLYDLHKEFLIKTGIGRFSLCLQSAICASAEEGSTDHIKNIIMKEFDAGYVPEIPDYAIDMHTIQGRARGRDVFISWMRQVKFSRFGRNTMIHIA